tara:strand:- start:478 stop:756 length:279 start_codon:yes stop_codon:yes gene_type:complete
MMKKISIEHKKMIRRIKILRGERGWPQTETADRLGMVRSSYADIEAGTKRIDLDKILAIANVLKVPVGFLINGERGDLSFERKEQIGKLFDL